MLSDGLMVVVFYLFKLFAWLVSLLPFRLLYMLSDVMAFFLRVVIRYRREVILTNLRKAFPEKSHHEITSIATQYYQNLSDIILEVLKVRNLSREDLLKRYTFDHYHLIEDSFSREKSIIVAIGHCGNWEWMGPGLWLITSQKGFAVVKPLTDKHFDQYMTSLRHKFNPNCTIPFKETFRTMARHNREMLSFTVIAADQTPTRGEINYWTNFLGQETPFFLGVEKISKALDMSVVFIELTRVSRGRYHGDIKLITDDPKSTRPYEITERYVSMLEDAIRRNPDNWLWSHKRWKHSREAAES